MRYLPGSSFMIGKIKRRHSSSSAFESKFKKSLKLPPSSALTPLAAAPRTLSTSSRSWFCVLFLGFAIPCLSRSHARCTCYFCLAIRSKSNCFIFVSTASSSFFNLVFCLMNPKALSKPRLALLFSNSRLDTLLLLSWERTS